MYGVQCSRRALEREQKSFSHTLRDNREKEEVICYIAAVSRARLIQCAHTHIQYSTYTHCTVLTDTVQYLHIVQYSTVIVLDLIEYYSTMCILGVHSAMCNMIAKYLGIKHTHNHFSLLL